MIREPRRSSRAAALVRAGVLVAFLLIAPSAGGTELAATDAAALESGDHGCTRPDCCPDDGTDCARPCCSAPTVACLLPAPQASAAPSVSLALAAPILLRPSASPRAPDHPPRD